MTKKELQLFDYLSSYNNRPAAWRDDRLEKKLAVFRDLSSGLAKLSTCRRLAVGCVIVPLDLSSVLAIGYNGPSSGEDNSSCNSTEGTCSCIHAEANALVKLHDARDSLLLTTISPCLHCAGLIINSGIVKIVAYISEYRDLSGLNRLRNAGIVVARLS